MRQSRNGNVMAKQVADIDDEIFTVPPMQASILNRIVVITTFLEMIGEKKKLRRF